MMKQVFITLLACCLGRGLSAQQSQTSTEIEAVVKSSKDPGFQTMVKDSVVFRKEMGWISTTDGCTGLFLKAI